MLLFKFFENLPEAHGTLLASVFVPVLIFDGAQVDCHAIERLDELEGVSKGNYVRRSIVLSDLQLEPDYSNSVDLIAHAYFAAPSYASRLAVAPHIEAFTEKESATYVRRKDRPQNRTFLQHIEHWIKAQEVARRTNQCSKILH